MLVKLFDNSIMENIIFIFSDNVGFKNTFAIWNTVNIERLSSSYFQ